MSTLKSKRYVESKVFVDRANGQWELWAYVDYRRYYLGAKSEWAEVEQYAKKYGYQILRISRS